RSDLPKTTHFPSGEISGSDTAIMSRTSSTVIGRFGRCWDRAEAAAIRQTINIERNRFTILDPLRQAPYWKTFVSTDGKWILSKIGPGVKAPGTSLSRAGWRNDPHPTNIRLIASLRTPERSRFTNIRLLGTS